MFCYNIMLYKTDVIVAFIVLLKSIYFMVNVDLTIQVINLYISLVFCEPDLLVVL